MVFSGGTTPGIKGESVAMDSATMLIYLTQLMPGVVVSECESEKESADVCQQAMPPQHCRLL